MDAAEVDRGADLPYGLWQSSSAGANASAAVVVLPPIHGVTPYVKDVVSSLESDGLRCAVVDYFTDDSPPSAGADLTEILAAVTRLDVDKACETVLGASAQLRDGRSPARRPVAVLGFCIGGTLALHAAVRTPDLAAAVVFYPSLRFPPDSGLPASPLEHVHDLDVPLLGHFGSDDHLVPQADVEELRDALRGRSAELYSYPGAGHAFHEWTNPDRYRPVAAADAWTRTRAFFSALLQPSGTAAGPLGSGPAGTGAAAATARP